MFIYKYNGRKQKSFYIQSLRPRKKSADLFSRAALASAADKRSLRKRRRRNHVLKELYKEHPQSHRDFFQILKIIHTTLGSLRASPLQCNKQWSSRLALCAYISMCISGWGQNNVSTSCFT